MIIIQKCILHIIKLCVLKLLLWSIVQMLQRQRDFFIHIHLRENVMSVHVSLCTIRQTWWEKSSSVIWTLVTHFGAHRRWFLHNFKTAHDIPNILIQLFHDMVTGHICQSHQIILYERQLWHICSWKACLQSLNIDPRGFSRGASHEYRKEERKNRSLVILIRWSVKLRLPDVSVCIWVDRNPSHDPFLSPWASEK